MNARGLPILIAEDSEDEAVLLDHALKAIGVANPVHIVTSGEQVIAYLTGKREYSDRAMFPLPAVVITDLKMARVSGFELLDWLRRHSRFKIIPTLVFSNSAEPRDIEHAYALGANAYLVKPRTMERLEAMMRTTFEFLSWCARAPAPLDSPCEAPRCAALAAT